MENSYSQANEMVNYSQLLFIVWVPAVIHTYFSTGKTIRIVSDDLTLPENIYNNDHDPA